MESVDDPPTAASTGEEFTNMVKRARRLAIEGYVQLQLKHSGKLVASLAVPDPRLDMRLLTGDEDSVAYVNESVVKARAPYLYSCITKQPRHRGLVQTYRFDLSQYSFPVVSAMVDSLYFGHYPTSVWRGGREWKAPRALVLEDHFHIGALAMDFKMSNLTEMALSHIYDYADYDPTNHRRLIQLAHEPNRNKEWQELVKALAAHVVEAKPETTVFDEFWPGFCDTYSEFVTNCVMVYQNSRDGESSYLANIGDPMEADERFQPSDQN